MLLVSVVVSMVTFAQKTLEVQRFIRQDNDLMARVTKPVRDHDEGKLCALIRVVTPLTDLEVRADGLGIVHKEQHAGELWLYVPYGAKSLSLSHQGYYPLLYQYVLPIEEGVVYELRLGSSDVPTSNQSTQLFVLTHQPDAATVFIDGMEVTSDNGVFAAMMSKGVHSYRITADQYEESEGRFELGDAVVRETVRLQPLFGMFRITTQPEDGFDVKVDGHLMGKTPYRSDRLEPGHYRVHIEKSGFYPKDTLIRLREGDDLNITCRLTSHADSLFFNRRLGGRGVSFGINASYLFPFVASSSGGGFTGSPINYSLSDEREDVSYTAQSGFSVGIMADIRLYKNLYLIIGANYSQYKYRNTFAEPINSSVISAKSSYAVEYGNMKNNYRENYTLNLIEAPILASYRIVLTKAGSLHLNLGPYISYGLSAKLKLSGATETETDTYVINGGVVDLSHSLEHAWQSYHLDSNIDLYSDNIQFTKIYESGINLQHPIVSDNDLKDSPYNRLNYGLKMGITYELRSFQFGIAYTHMLSNMGNKDFWESARVPIFNGKTGANNMSGYKHHIHAFEIRLGYVFRY